MQALLGSLVGGHLSGVCTKERMYIPLLFTLQSTFGGILVLVPFYPAASLLNNAHARPCSHLWQEDYYYLVHPHPPIPSGNTQFLQVPPNILETLRGLWANTPISPSHHAPNLGPTKPDKIFTLRQGELQIV